ncbi:39180_t:CDS:2, partial [Gigaspora margarita]
MELWLDHSICLSTIWRAIYTLGYTHKQLLKPAKEINKIDRRNFVLKMSQYTANQLVFSDELAYDKRTLSLRYSWSFLGHCAQKFSFFVKKKQFIIEGALCINSLLAYSIQEGSMNTQDYENFIENVLLPKINLFPEQFSVLVLDNTSIHRKTCLYNLCQEKGIKLEFLPLYLSDYNPTESMKDPLDVLDLTYMTIGANLARACFQY